MPNFPTGLDVPPLSLQKTADAVYAIEQLLSGTTRLSYVSAPQGWNTAWKTAKAASASKIAGVLFFGDSICSGVNSSSVADIFDYGYAGLIRSGFSSIPGGIGLGADFFNICPNVASGANNPANFAGNPWGTPSNSAGVYEQGLGRSLDLGPSATVTFTVPYTTDSHGMDLIYTDFGARTAAFVITGAPGGTITVNTVADHGLHQVNIPGPITSGTVITITGNASSNGCMLSGMAVHFAEAGIGYIRNGYTGAKMVDFVSPGGTNFGAGGPANNPYSISWPPDKVGPWGYGTGTNAAPVTGFPWQPALAIIEPLVNDAASLVSLPVFSQSYAKLIRSLRAGTPNCSIICMAPYFPDSRYGDNTAATEGGEQYPAYKLIARELASSYNCAFFDVDSWWQNEAVTDTFVALNNIHPTASSTGAVSGHSAIAGVLMSLMAA